MTEIKDNTESRGFPWGLVILAMFILYVLSIGPFWALALGNAGVIPRGMVYPIWDSVYLPISWVAETVPAVGSPLEKYVNWWLPDRLDFRFG